MELSKYAIELIQAGFKQELPSISKHSLQVIHDGFEYSKRLPSLLSEDDYEIGVYINPTYGGMQIFGCNCVLTCCGEEITDGITPFSMDKVTKLIDEFIIADQECKLGFKRH